jgi:hypothetical protein
MQRHERCVLSEAVSAYNITELSAKWYRLGIVQHPR